MRYAQESGGQRLHLVAETDPQLTGSIVAFRALCGREPRKRGRWMRTYNVPLGMACRRCGDALDRLQTRAK
jgi:hypothetical protein